MLNKVKSAFGGKKIISGIGGIVGILLVAGVVLAAPGDQVPPGPIAPPGPLGAGCGGIGVAFDGTNIWYTCAGEDKIRKTDLTGADNGFITTAEGATPVSVDAIAWDPTEGKIWGGELVDTDAVAGNDTCRIYSIDPVSGAAVTKFSRTDTGCTFFFFDGLTVDSVTDTLYYSPDVQKNILHLDKTGAPLAGSPIDFETLTSAPDACPGHEPVSSDDPLVDGCPNSGLTIGLDGTLFAGTNGAGKIVSLDPVAETFLGEFTSVTGRDEDLECGPTVEGKETLLSRDFETGRIDVLEVTEGTCRSPVEPPADERRMTGGGTIVGKALVGLPTEVKHGFELHCDATADPNRLEVNWGKGNKFHLESLTSAICSDDPAIVPNPPVAGFDTYEGSGSGRYNGVSGATAKWVFKDAGEPGKDVTARIHIEDSGGATVVDLVGKLKVGNQQAHK